MKYSISKIHLTKQHKKLYRYLLRQSTDDGLFVTPSGLHTEEHSLLAELHPSDSQIASSAELSRSADRRPNLNVQPALAHVTTNAARSAFPNERLFVRALCMSRFSGVIISIYTFFVDRLTEVK
ncbi:hypothetical protein NPIL_613591 [Nephila pilipes]|uniref:Uncharacterized protein n=1 Tax=Nephila pilipes TaxID=299642 RepID=A0A8X6QR30_NEPPI|nr:hypothetical protein NPIL_613591 [Nephila pilipes]